MTNPGARRGSPGAFAASPTKSCDQGLGTILCLAHFVAIGGHTRARARGRSDCRGGSTDAHRGAVQQRASGSLSCAGERRDPSNGTSSITPIRGCMVTKKRHDPRARGSQKEPPLKKSKRLHWAKELVVVPDVDSNKHSSRIGSPEYGLVEPSTDKRSANSELHSVDDGRGLAKDNSKFRT